MKRYSCRMSFRWGCEPLIKEIEIERETNKYIWIKNGNRRAKRSSYANIYETFDEAKKALILSQEEHVHRLSSRLKYEKINLDKIKEMTLEDVTR